MAMNRKDFFKYTGRCAVLCGVGVLTGYLVYNQKIVTPENCSLASQCKNCGSFNKCLLPQADKERNDGK
jgi:hypothetical protein